MALAFLISIVIINKIIYKSWLNLIVLQSVVWLVYYLILQGCISFFDINLAEADLFILVQVFGFSLGGFLCVLFTKTKGVFELKEFNADNVETCQKNLTFLLPLLFVILIIVTVMLIKQSDTLSLTGMFTIREVMVEDDGAKFGFFGLVQFMLSVYIIIYIAVKQPMTLLFKWFIGFFLLFTLLLNSKAAFAFITITLLYVLIWQKRVNIFLVLTSFLVLIILFLIVTIIRIGENGNAETFRNLVLVYLVSAIPGLVIAKHVVPMYWGYHSFRNIYLWANKFGATFPIAPVLSEYTPTPLPTNTYSYIKPYYYDFGLWGVFLLPLFVGFISNYWYYKARRGSIIYLVMTALFFYPVVMQIFDEHYYRWISNWVYFFLFTYIIVKVRIQANDKV